MDKKIFKPEGSKEKELRVAVLGEGPTDYGRQVPDKKQKRDVWQEGPAFPLIRRTAQAFGREVVLEAVNKKEVLHIQSSRRFKQLKGLVGKANDSARFALYMEMHGFLYGIFYCDTDKEPGEKNTDEHVCRKLFSRVYHEVVSGITAVGIQKQQVIPMVALKMVECWLLADRAVYQQAFGIKAPRLPAKPELIWGDDEDPESDYPKHYMKRVLKRAKNEMVKPGQETFVQIAEAMSLDVLRQTCGISFQRFYEDLSQMVLQTDIT